MLGQGRGGRGVNSFNVNDVLGSSSTTCTEGKRKHLRGNPTLPAALDMK